MSERSNVTRLLTEKNALDRSHIEQHPEDLSAGAGEIVVKLNRLSLTTNNITYAAFGDSMNYWDFFPTGDATLGHVPVWGFADVVASNVDGIAVGERFYGYFPIASHLRMQPERVSDRGFYDATAHRQKLVSAYNQYTRCSWDPYYSPATENLQILLKPLFLTSAMLADFLRDNDFFGASRVVFSSASSKTAFGTAVCLDGAPVQRVALTSRSNTAFVQGLGCYEQSLAYDDLAQLANDQPTLYVDFSSDLGLRDRVHQHFGEQLVYSCCAGSAQNTDPAQLTAITGPKPQLFFAPIQLRKRNADWGPVKVSEYIGEGLVRFYDQVTPLLDVVVSQGFAAAQELIARLYNGQVPAKEGHIVELA
ncbi:MAG: DUF2855 family protein [Pseudomonas sp.]